MLPIVVSKNLRALSSNGVATFSSAGAFSTLNTSDLGTARRLVVWGSSSLNGATVTIYGSDDSFASIAETVIVSTTPGAVTQTVQDFRAVSSVAISGTLIATAGYIGTSSQGGTPWYPVDTCINPINVGFNLTPSTTGIVVSFEYSMGYPQYDRVSRTWPQCGNVLSGPSATISSMGSSVTSATNGYINFPITAWRITLSSSSSGAGTANAVVAQDG